MSNHLSPREREILVLICRGATNKEIGEDLTITQNTVKTHVRNIFSKLGVSSRTRAALVGLGIHDDSEETPKIAGGTR